MQQKIQERENVIKKINATLYQIKRGKQLKKPEDKELLQFLENLKLQRTELTEQINKIRQQIKKQQQKEEKQEKQQKREKQPKTEKTPKQHEKGFSLSAKKQELDQLKPKPEILQQIEQPTPIFIQKLQKTVQQLIKKTQQKEQQQIEFVKFQQQKYEITQQNQFINQLQTKLQQNEQKSEQLRQQLLQTKDKKEYNNILISLSDLNLEAIDLENNIQILKNDTKKVIKVDYYIQNIKQKELKAHNAIHNTQYKEGEIHFIPDEQLNFVQYTIEIVYDEKQDFVRQFKDTVMEKLNISDNDNVILVHYKKQTNQENILYAQTQNTIDFGIMQQQNVRQNGNMLCTEYFFNIIESEYGIKYENKHELHTDMQIVNFIKQNDILRKKIYIFNHNFDYSSLKNYDHQILMQNQHVYISKKNKSLFLSKKSIYKKIVPQKDTEIKIVRDIYKQNAKFICNKNIIPLQCVQNGELVSLYHENVLYIEQEVYDKCILNQQKFGMFTKNISFKNFIKDFLVSPNHQELYDYQYKPIIFQETENVEMCIDQNKSYLRAFCDIQDIRYISQIKFVQKQYKLKDLNISKNSYIKISLSRLQKLTEKQMHVFQFCNTINQQSLQILKKYLPDVIVIVHIEYETKSFGKKTPQISDFDEIYPEITDKSERKMLYVKTFGQLVYKNDDKGVQYVNFNKQGFKNHQKMENTFQEKMLKRQIQEQQKEKEQQETQEQETQEEKQQETQQEQQIETMKRFSYVDNLKLTQIQTTKNQTFLHCQMINQQFYNLLNGFDINDICGIKTDCLYFKKQVKFDTKRFKLEQIKNQHYIIQEHCEKPVLFKQNTDGKTILQSYAGYGKTKYIIQQIQENPDQTFLVIVSKNSQKNQYMNYLPNSNNYQTICWQFIDLINDFSIFDKYKNIYIDEFTLVNFQFLIKLLYKVQLQDHQQMVFIGDVFQQCEVNSSQQDYYKLRNLHIFQSGVFRQNLRNNLDYEKDVFSNGEIDRKKILDIICVNGMAIDWTYKQTNDEWILCTENEQCFEYNKIYQQFVKENKKDKKENKKDKQEQEKENKKEKQYKSIIKNPDQKNNIQFFDTHKKHQYFNKKREIMNYYGNSMTIYLSQGETLQGTLKILNPEKMNNNQLYVSISRTNNNLIIPEKSIDYYINYYDETD